MRSLKLADSAVQAWLAVLRGWSLRGNEIVRTFAFPDFVAALRFVNAIAEAAEAADHHPDIDIRYNKVTLALTTHDSGGLTEKDFALAAQADTLAT
ncbi:4a-hydroxytetrahydrobiopterin dehydratase [Armatimonas sp.]|uniref:4a-hydroxytetrahydrobiopterin dehydratase n=1 Tax=Armatimonas sp. TaxID=1872638 RepID=UPI003750324F